MFKHAQLETVKAWISDPANGSLPLHERIQRAIRTLILEGTLSHGKALPASRALATSLNVSRDTVEAAYSSLHAEGFIERQTGRGSFVSSSARFLKPRIRQHPPTAETRKAKLSARGKVIYESGGIREFSSPRPLAPGIPETRLFPIPTSGASSAAGPEGISAQNTGAKSTAGHGALTAGHRGICQS